MFAVLKTGGKQYKVTSGDVIRVEKLAADAGETVQFNDILMMGSTVGTPLVEGAGVQAEVIDQIKGPKTINYVRRRRKHSSKRTKGHRQSLTLLRVTELMEKGADKSGVKAAVGAGSLTTSEAPAAKPAAKKAAPKKDAAPKTKAEAPKAETAATTGREPGNLLKEARDGKPDDLKKITGVGPKLEGTLHEAGVFHFDQIAAWGPEEVAYMDEKLSFKGRIERDNWIEQATQFAAEKE
ncbi:50S ribosomal protein L21 [Histidinibacterium aquaticum]|uniref:Large ribosomal subunit protein bL21 n=1 Tax=Histidinibacterium aquaticum TaxID=2613962 RepID=A0A5J5GL58_9RHOB|nr:50S ribosomal protein L21 [Histidinibacterium aquaticum]KAA9008880.1 50S ribosomal protein L21 [Histidinibacterium aquaticum]